jgi:hypothetical protein
VTSNEWIVLIGASAVILTSGLLFAAYWIDREPKPRKYDPASKARQARHERRKKQ